MTEEEKQRLLLKEICARLPYLLKMDCGTVRPYHILQTIYVDAEDGHVDLLDDVGFTYKLEDVKLLLRPLSSMTEEEAKDIATLTGIKDIISINITEKYIEVIKDDGFCSTETITIWFSEIVSSIEIFDYLNSHHFDYRGLIEIDLAEPLDCL